MYRAVLFFRVVLKPQTHTDAAPLDAHYPTAPPAGRRPPRRSKPSPPSPHHARHVTGNTPISTTPRSSSQCHSLCPLAGHARSALKRTATAGSPLSFPLLSCTRAHKRQPHAAAAAAASRTRHTPEKLLSPSATPQHSTTSTFSSTHTQHYFVPLSRSLTHKRAHWSARRSPFKASRPRVQPPERGLQAASI